MTGSERRLSRVVYHWHMRTDPLAISALILCGLGWLLAAASLLLGLAGRLPGRHSETVSAFLLMQATILALLTAALLSQVATLARWALPVREAIGLLTVVVAIGTMVALVKAVTPSLTRAKATNPQTLR